jgi:hypothetical protein
MKRTIGTFAAAFLLAVAADARADQGNAVIESKSQGEVVLSGRTYRVSSSTALESKEGARLSFADLPATAEGASHDDAAVWYEASDDERMPTATRIKLVGSVPD